ncbi:hypothetical protein HK102_002684 [Quaeritorhiza haematococci]|nr:hypothetical protein HK102_002684 [Quaeritorhiza haematococci]
MSPPTIFILSLLFAASTASAAVLPSRLRADARTATEPPGAARNVPITDTSIPCSQRSETPVTLMVSNEGQSDIALFWNDFDCDDQMWGVLPPGKATAVSTFSTHAWFVRELATQQNTNMQVYTVASEPATQQWAIRTTSSSSDSDDRDRNSDRNGDRNGDRNSDRNRPNIPSNPTIASTSSSPPINSPPSGASTTTSTSTSTSSIGTNPTATSSVSVSNPTTNDRNIAIQSTSPENATTSTASEVTPSPAPPTSTRRIIIIAVIAGILGAKGTVFSMFLLFRCYNRRRKKQQKKKQEQEYNNVMARFNTLASRQSTFSTKSFNQFNQIPYPVVADTAMMRALTTNMQQQQMPLPMPYAFPPSSDTQSLASRTNTTSTTFSSVSNAAATQPASTTLVPGQTYTIVYAHIRNFPDELDTKVGEKATVHAVFDDGWVLVSTEKENGERSERGMIPAATLSLTPPTTISAKVAEIQQDSGKSNEKGSDGSVGQDPTIAKLRETGLLSPTAPSPRTASMAYSKMFK